MPTFFFLDVAMLVTSSSPLMWAQACGTDIAQQTRAHDYDRPTPRHHLLRHRARHIRCISPVAKSITSVLVVDKVDSSQHLALHTPNRRR